MRDHRDAGEECRRRLEVANGARDSMAMSLSAASISVDECRKDLEAKEAAASSVRADCDRLAARCDADASEARRKVRIVEDEKRAVEWSLELCEQSSLANHAGGTPAQNDQSPDESNSLVRDNGESERQLEHGETDNRDDIHPRNNKLLSASHKELFSKVKAVPDGMDENGRDKEKKRNDSGEGPDWVNVFLVI